MSKHSNHLRKRTTSKHLSKQFFFKLVELKNVVTSGAGLRALDKIKYE